MSQERTDNLFASESWTAVYTAFTNISLKAYDFDTIREALLGYTAQTYPDKFNDFIASSEFVAILDLVAYLGHSLSYRLDMNTRENFMDTAERRASILQMAKSLGYNKTRPINAKGFMKITSLSTDENVYDNLGVTLAGKSINWNDSNDIDWYENFISVLNSAFSSTTKIQNPTSTLTVADVEHSLYEINEDSETKNINYSFSANVDGKSRNFEAVRVLLDTVNARIEEDEPKLNNNFTIINRNDNLGSASDRTGFFVYAVAGTLGFEDFTYNTQVSNRIQRVNAINISNSDVWIQKIDSTSVYVSSVTKVDNETRETAIYNSLRTGSGDIVSINSADNNTIELHYPDGIFGNAAYGNYRAWYRIADNDNFSVNANDITNTTITIPYTGSDNRTYRLSLTISSTKDFTENFSGETYASVRRIAPRSYYAQDRMVNAQDYNVYPLTLGNNVVNKVKAVNTSFAGNSRFYEMDDVLGHHSNLSIIGSDGSVFVEDEPISISLSYNKSKGNSDNFIRNDIANTIKHPSLLNKFLHENKTNTTEVVLAQTGKTYTVDPLDGMKISATSMTETVYVGDTLKLETNSGITIWADVKTVSGTDYTLNKKIQEDGDNAPTVDPDITPGIKTIVRGFRTKFNETEIAAIKAKVDPNGLSFTLYYTYTIVSPATTPTWNWSLTSSVATDVSVEFKYESGIRDNEAEYKVTFIGKKVAFESLKQVKFYYGNTTDVIDNETNLSQRDKIFLNHHQHNDAEDGDTTPTVEKNVTVGQTPISNYNSVGSGATFKANFHNTGARITYDFIENNDYGTQTTYTHDLISPDGQPYPLEDGTGTDPNITSHDSGDPGWPIGDTTDLGDGINTIECAVPDLSIFLGTSTFIETRTNIASSETNLSNINLWFTGTTGNVANATSSFTTLTSQEISDRGFKGEISLTYFDAAATSSNFVWLDVSDSAEQNEFTTVYNITSTPNQYEFTLPTQVGFQINHLDDDIYFKQYAYGEFSIISSTPITNSNIVLKDNVTQIEIPSSHVTVTLDSGTTYKIVFWTYAVTVGQLIDVSTAGVATELDNTWSVRVTASFKLGIETTTSSTTYKTLASYVYDDYITSAGYVDNTKVKLLTSDTNDNPFALLDITKPNGIVMEEYGTNVPKFERASTYAASAASEGKVPTTATIYYNTTDDDWYMRVGGGWSVLTPYVPLSNNLKINYNDTQYRVLEGINFVEDSLSSFRWEHYADLDKRIDPSTSNIVDMYVLSSDYVRKVNEWVANNFTTTTPTPPNNYELSKIMDTIEPKAAMADHIAYIPVQFKYLFGSYAESENQAVFKVIKRLGVGYTDSEIKTAVSTKVNEYFAIDNWDFGDIFYFSELAAYLHKELGDYISSIVVTPKVSLSGTTNEFTNLLSISCALNEIFMAVTTSSDVKIITQLAQSELIGE